jgi:hypothetical protein
MFAGVRCTTELLKGALAGGCAGPPWLLGARLSAAGETGSELAGGLTAVAGRECAACGALRLFGGGGA